MKKISNWLKGFYNEYQVLIIGIGVLVGVGGFIWGIISSSIDYHKDNVTDNSTEYVKTEEVNGHSYVTLRQKISWDYEYYVLHDPDCNCNN